MADTKDQLAEIEKEIEDLHYPDAMGNFPSDQREQIEKAEAKLQGFLLGTISQLKEEKEFLRTHWFYDEEDKGDFELRLDKITADLKEAEDKLKKLSK